MKGNDNMSKELVESSLIKSVDYDSDTQNLAVELLNLPKKKATYTFVNVPEGVYKKFLKSSSKGQFFNTKIKNVYKIAA